MDDLTSLIAHHGYLVICVIVFAEAIGVPVPGAVALVAGGAAAASGALNAPAVVLFAVAAMLAADALLYVLGSVTGWALLKFLCRVSVDPETCVLHSAESFYKRGRTTLLIAKFIPGVSTMAAPLAGSIKCRFCNFWDWIFWARAFTRYRMARSDLSSAISSRRSSADFALPGTPWRL